MTNDVNHNPANDSADRRSSIASADTEGHIRFGFSEDEDTDTDTEGHVRHLVDEADTDAEVRAQLEDADTEGHIRAGVTEHEDTEGHIRF